MHEKHESSASYKDICEAKTRLIKGVVEELNHGLEHIDAKELGEVTDMIKDLAEAEKLCQEACYYESVVDAMDTNKDDPAWQRYGYKRMSDNLYNPYAPIYGQDSRFDRYFRDPYSDMDNMRMGFPKDYRMSLDSNRSRDSMGRYTSDGRQGSRSGYDDGEWDRDNDPRYGRAYNDYRKARRHYTESHMQTDKDMMNQRVNEHIADTIVSIKEMWEDADPTLRKKMKADLTSLVGTMNV